MVSHTVTYRKKPIYYNKFPYKLSFKCHGAWIENKNNIILLLGYTPSMPSQRLTADGFLYFSKYSEYNNIRTLHNHEIYEAFEPSEGYINMKSTDDKFELWYNIYPYKLKFKIMYYKTMKNKVLPERKIRDWCLQNIKTKYYISFPNIYFTNKTDLITTKLMFANFVILSKKACSDTNIIKLLQDNIDKATNILTEFKKDIA